jgi:hypothetical protein
MKPSILLVVWLLLSVACNSSSENKDGTATTALSPNADDAFVFERSIATGETIEKAYAPKLQLKKIKSFSPRVDAPVSRSIDRKHLLLMAVGGPENLTK